MPDIPHFDLPFRLAPGGGHPLTVEQDSLRDIANCAEAIVRTERGQRVELPTFGINDPVFVQGGLSPEVLLDEIKEYEPRAELAIEKGWEFYDWCETLRIEVVRGGGGNE
jgi:phage baseplate assembly protein W